MTTLHPIYSPIVDWCGRRHMRESLKWLWTNLEKVSTSYGNIRLAFLDWSNATSVRENLFYVFFGFQKTW